jgi:hypothetical protein
MHFEERNIKKFSHKSRLKQHDSGLPWLVTEANLEWLTGSLDYNALDNALCSPFEMMTTTMMMRRLFKRERERADGCDE